MHMESFHKSPGGLKGLHHERRTRRAEARELARSFDRGGRPRAIDTLISKTGEELLCRCRQKINRTHAPRCRVFLGMLEELRSKSLAPGAFIDDQRTKQGMGAA